VKLAKFRRPKAASSLSYVEYRPNTNVAILWDTDHTKGRSVIGGIGQGKENQELECG
jgi:hypothetical protein